ncbi:MAG: hypothetical protein IJS42_05825, partial [Synergistaceae bacterium]|nr:hypothetical protein [Synergistaceae bacterium]
ASNAPVRFRFMIHLSLEPFRRVKLWADCFAFSPVKCSFCFATDEKRDATPLAEGESSAYLPVIWGTHTIC